MHFYLIIFVFSHAWGWNIYGQNSDMPNRRLANMLTSILSFFTRRQAQTMTNWNNEGLTKNVKIIIYRTLFRLKDSHVIISDTRKKRNEQTDRTFTPKQMKIIDLKWYVYDQDNNISGGTAFIVLLCEPSHWLTKNEY